MKQPISKDRTQLAQLLTRLIGEPENEALRYRAARLALRVALDEKDASASDLLESLLASPSAATALPASQEQLYLRATARAARKAIYSMGGSTEGRGTRHLLNQACADPSALREALAGLHRRLEG